MKKANVITLGVQLSLVVMHPLQCVAAHVNVDSPVSTSAELVEQDLLGPATRSHGGIVWLTAENYDAHIWIDNDDGHLECAVFVQTIAARSGRSHGSDRSSSKTKLGQQTSTRVPAPVPMVAIVWLGEI